MNHRNLNKHLHPQITSTVFERFRKRFSKFTSLRRIPLNSAQVLMRPKSGPVWHIFHALFYHDNGQVFMRNDARPSTKVVIRKYKAENYYFFRLQWVGGPYLFKNVDTNGHYSYGTLCREFQFEVCGRFVCKLIFKFYCSWCELRDALIVFSFSICRCVFNKSLTT